MVDKVRTRKAVLERVLQMGKEAFGDQPVFLGIIHARNPESAVSVMEETKKRFNFKDAVQSDLFVSLAINFDPGTGRLVLYPASE
jgi:fatty acid kinase fatty acid binding subunit